MEKGQKEDPAAGAEGVPEQRRVPGWCLKQAVRRCCTKVDPVDLPSLSKVVQGSPKEAIRNLEQVRE